MWGGNVDVTLVERNDELRVLPDLQPGARRQQADGRHHHAATTACAQLGVKVIRATCGPSIAAGKRRCAWPAARRAAYDRLVLSPGIDFMWDAVGGLARARQRRIPHAWKAGPQTVALRKQLEAMPDGGVYAMTIPQGALPLPARALRARLPGGHYFKQAKPKSKVLVLDANERSRRRRRCSRRPSPTATRASSNTAQQHELTDVDAATGTPKFEFDDVKADVLNVMPPQRAGDIARKRAWSTDQQPLGATSNWLTMESDRGRPACTCWATRFPAPLMPKSGHMANQHAKVARRPSSTAVGRAANPRRW
jgi:sulfite dehydrogenase